MSSRRVVNRLQLGPIVGHTDENSSRIWIQVFDDPGKYHLRVKGIGLFPFKSTEAPLGLALEFRTAIAVAEGLRSDWRYNYNILRKGRFIPGAKGSFRTMPNNGSMANIIFCAISCNAIFSDKGKTDGAWEAFSKFVKEAKPHFITMMGDQVYIDEDKRDIFTKFVKSSSQERRKALAEKYHENWSRKIVKEVMANVPIYMMWDDHEIRDGWGSLASDSKIMLQEYPRGSDIFLKSKTFFEDARDVYWHFQICHSPLGPPGPTLPNYIGSPPDHDLRVAMPYMFRCGRLLVLMLDSRGERDVFRKDLPVLGPRQWQFIGNVFDTLPDSVDALTVMTPTPIASMDPKGQVQKLMGERTDDVESFKKGDFEGLFDPHSPGGAKDFVKAVADHYGIPVGSVSFRAHSINEVRDQWSHRFSRPEQISLLRAADKARLTNRIAGSPRDLIFISGDIHIGCIFDITFSNTGYKAASLTSSGISTVADSPIQIGALIDDDFDVTSGIRSSLREAVKEFNFGVVQVIPTGSGAEIVPSLAHEGNSFTIGLDIADLL